MCSQLLSETNETLIAPGELLHTIGAILTVILMVLGLINIYFPRDVLPSIGGMVDSFTGTFIMADCTY